MHDILADRLSRFARSASSPEAHGSQKSDLLELAKLCQIVPQNQYLVDAVARDLSPAVNRVFGATSLIVALTETSRRQVYFAVIARLEQSGAINQIACDEVRRLSLIESLLLSRSADLICQHYDSCPRGFLRLLARLGDRARSSEFYLNLHQLLTVKPDLARDLGELARNNNLSDVLVAVLMSMPPAMQCARIARNFTGTRNYQQLRDLYGLLTGANGFTAEHCARLANGETPSRLLERIYLEIPFPEPRISAPGLRYIKNGAELVSASKRFRNCLNDFVAEAIRNEHQYYVWNRKDAPSLIFSIQNDAPFGWFLRERLLAGNKCPSIHLAREHNALLEHCGIRILGSVENMMRPHRSRRGELDLDHELFELDAA